MSTIDRRAYEGDIVSRLRHWRGLHLAHGGMLFEEAAAEIDRLRLTDEEREAIEFFAWIHSDDEPPHEHADALAKLLARLA